MLRAASISAYLFVLMIIGNAGVNAQSAGSGVGLSNGGGQYPFVHYTPKDGLVNSRVKKAYQDSKGRMYFLTYGGLSIYDGARFRNYTRENGLADDVVNDILEVGNDSLLVATNSEHYLNVLVRGKISALKTQGDSCGTVNQFYRHDNGKLYLSSDNGLFVLENTSIHELNVSFLSTTSPELPYLGGIAGIGNWLVLSTHELKENKGLYLYDVKKNTICDALPASQFHLLGKDKSNKIWIAKSDKLFIVDSNALIKGKLLLTSPVRGYQQAKNYSTVNVAFDNNCLWLVYRDKDYNNKEIRRIEETGSVFRMPLPEQVASSSTAHIIVDREKIIWLCNNGEGVYKIVNSTMHLFEDPFGKSLQDRSNNVFYSNNVTWHSTGTHKLFRRSDKGLQEFICNVKPSPQLFYEKDGKLLANDHLNIYEGKLDEQTKFIRFNKIISLPDSDFFAKQVIRDPYGAIISTQKSGLGVWKENQLIYHEPIYRTDNIEQLALDNGGLLWVVKRYTGIGVFRINSAASSQYLETVFHFNKEQLAGSPRCFLIDKNGLIWIGTREHGLIGYKQDNDRLNKLYHFEAGNGLTDNFITSIACDSLNNIIVGTQTGLDRILFNKDGSGRIENLSKGSNYFVFINQVWAEKERSFALTSLGALIQLSDPFQERATRAPGLLLEEIKVNAQPVLFDKYFFTHKENNLSFLVAAPSFVDEKQVTYSYLLEGSGNDQWSDTSSANAVINLTNLSAGKYLLNVKAFFPSTHYDPVELRYPFAISPPWWQTWWFRTIAGLVIIGLLIAATRFYYRGKLEKQKALLEKQQAIEKERTRIATDMHDDLGAGLSRIKFLSENIKANKGNDEAMLKDIEKISGYSNEMAEKMGEIVWALNEKNDTLADLVAFTRSYVQEYLSGQNIHCELNTPLELPSTFITGEMRQHIFLSVKECLHNIVKHAEASRVYFSVKLNGAIEIIIHDNGKGIDWNNRRAFSNGIENINRRMKEINGKASFANEHGTKVSLTIPTTS